jgi:outer membrane protein OmpA-like peptidoglycan-associated protein
MSNPKRNRHEQKPDQQAGFKGGHVPSSRAHPKTRVGNAEREVWPRADTREEKRLTGQWRDPNGRFHLFINQAGAHIELLLALVPNGAISKKGSLPDSDRLRRHILRLGGDVDASDRRIYHLYVERPGGPIDAKDLVCGKLVNLEKDLRLELEASDAIVNEIKASAAAIERLNSLTGSEVRRFGSAPNFFDRHLIQPKMPVETRTSLWFPPTPQQLKKVGGTLFDARVWLDSESYLSNVTNRVEFGYVDLISAYFDNQANDDINDQQRAQRRTNIGTALDELVKIGHGNALQLPPEQGGIDEHQDPIWTVKTLEALARKQVIVVGEKSRSLLELTRVVLQGLAGMAMPHFAKFLHLRRTEGGDTYNIALELELIDSGDPTAQRKAEKRLDKLTKQTVRRIKRLIPQGGLVGMARIDKPDPSGFSAQYVVWLSGLNISLGTAAGRISSTGIAKHVYGQPWLPEQIQGTVTLAQGSFSVYDDSDGTAAGLAYLACFGSGEGKPTGPLNFNCSGFSKLFADEPGIGGAAVFYGGQLVFVREDPKKFTIDAPPEEEVLFEYDINPGAGPTLHFPINGAGIEASGAALLDIFAACELAVLGQPTMEMTLTGYADQPDDEIRNMILSRNRAMSVYNYLKNILADELAGPELEPIPLSEADEIADAKAQRDQTDSEAFTIFVPKQDRIHIEAKGEPGSDKHGKPLPDAYDAQLRRVDIRVHGAIKLSLLRKKDD